MEKSRRHHAECSDEGETNMKALGFCVVMVATVMASSTWADSLYRCQDGTFTNKAERQCPPYEPKGIVRVQPRPNGEHAKEVREGSRNESVAIIGVFDEPTKRHTKDE
jgi:hypothetical protein